MLKKLFFAAFLFVSVAAMAQSDVKFEKEKYSFGKIKQNIPATYVFKFKNTGAKPVVIESATAGCGCTTPEYPKAPVAKGKMGEIKVTYNAANPGVFTKDVTVKVAGNTTPIVLTITGEVITAATAPKDADKPVPAKAD